MKTAQAIDQISRMRTERWARGVEHYRNDPNAGFVGDAANELLEELVDGMNYLSVLAEQRRMEPWQIATLEHHLLQAAVLLLTGEGIMFYDQARSQVATRG